MDAREVFGRGASNLLKSPRRQTKHRHVWHHGTLGELRRQVPGKFTLAPLRHDDKMNPLLQVVCNGDGMPLGVVSSSYVLVDHGELVEALVHALNQSGLDPAGYPAEVYVGDNGARFGLRLVFPDLVYDPGDGHPVAGRVEVLNSVDRSLPLRLVIGFFRFVCSNGLIVGETMTNLLEIHRRGRIDVLRLQEVVAKGLRGLQEKSAIFAAMYRTGIPEGFTTRLLASAGKAWGRRETEEIGGAFDSGTYRGVEIPGISPPVVNLWQAFNVLVWVAARSRDLARQVGMVEAAHKIFAETLKTYSISLN
jgi:hypothetical protein